jgi:hypothetical protein
MHALGAYKHVCVTIFSSASTIARTSLMCALSLRCDQHTAKNECTTLDQQCKARTACTHTPRVSYNIALRARRDARLRTTIAITHTHTCTTRRRTLLVGTTLIRLLSTLRAAPLREEAAMSLSTCVICDAHENTHVCMHTHTHQCSSSFLSSSLSVRCRVGGRSLVVTEDEGTGAGGLLSL